MTTYFKGIFVRLKDILNNIFYYLKSITLYGVPPTCNKDKVMRSERHKQSYSLKIKFAHQFHKLV